MASLKVVEIFKTIQGEGPNAGTATTFVRFGGCNLRCPGWGTGLLPDGTQVRGCDTVYAVYPEWRSNWDAHTPDEVYDRITTAGLNHICITGGEPLTQPAEQLSQLVHSLLGDGYTIDLFTNGTRLLPDWARTTGVTVVMDYKLPGSGESGSFNNANWRLLQKKDEVKFVCKDRADFDAAAVAIIAYQAAAEAFSGFLEPHFSFGVVYGELEESLLAEWIIEDYPYVKLNVQVHKKIGVE